MRTDDLIRALAADTMPERPVAGAMLWVLVPALGGALLLLWLILGFRSDLLQAVSNPVALTRWVLAGALAVVSMRLALALARPEGGAQARLWPLAGVALLALGLLGWAYVTTPPGGRQMAMVGKTMWTCLLTIPLLSVLPVGGMLWALRRGATTVPARAGAVVGLAGSAAAAAVYALHCTEDSPLFYVTWYGVAILGVTLVSAAIGARVLRW